MDKALIRARLAHAEQRITLGERTIAQQLDIIARLKRGGRETTLAENTLRVFGQTQRAHLAERDRLLKAQRVPKPMTSSLFWLSGP